MLGNYSGNSESPAIVRSWMYQFEATWKYWPSDESGGYRSFILYKFERPAEFLLPSNMSGSNSACNQKVGFIMASWILIAAIVSVFAAFRLRIGAFTIFVFSVISLFLVVQIATGTSIMTAIAWMLLLTGGMQIGYTIGVLILSAFLYYSSRKKSTNRHDFTSGT
jgi:hypothetical protein